MKDKIKEIRDGVNIERNKEYIINELKYLNIKICIWQLRTLKQDNYNLEDLLNNWVIWILKAIESFDINKGVKFETYAYYKIRKEVSKELLMMLGIKRTQVKDILKNLRSDEEDIVEYNNSIYEPKEINENIENKEIYSQDQSIEELKNNIKELEKKYRKFSDKENNLIFDTYYNKKVKNIRVVDKIIKDFQLDK